MGNVYQCCYTNATRENNGVASTGWQSVAVSKDIPQKAYDKISSLQNKASAIRPNMTDEDGQILNAFELFCDEDYVYFLRTQYGLQDGRGRANMFSHGYVQAWNEDNVLADPNSFLTIDSENFKVTENDALEQLGQPLTRIEPFQENTVLEQAGLNNYTYQVFISCIYAKLSDMNIQKPLFVQYDGDEIQMRALLYCAFCGLPYYLRKQLSATVTGAVTESERTIVFSKNAEKEALYFIPSSGKNTILTQRVEKKIERFGYIDFAAKCFGKIAAKEYFDTLEQSAIALGNPSASDELVMKIAFQYMKNREAASYSDDELTMILSDILRASYRESELMDEYCSACLEEFSKRNLSLTDESENSLNQKIDVCVTKILLDTVKRYYFQRFFSMSTTEAAKKLSSMPKKMFDAYVPELALTQQGSDMLDVLYADKIRNAEQSDFALLKKIADESNFLVRRKKTAEYISEKAWQLYFGALEKESTEIWQDYQEYMEVMSKILPSGEILACSNSAKEAYWDSFKLKKIDVAQVVLYRNMHISNEKSQFVLEFCQSVEVFPTINENQFISAISKLFESYTEVLIGEDVYGLIDILVKYLPVEEEKIQYLTRWLQIAVIGRMAPYLEDVLLFKTYLEHGQYLFFIENYSEYFAAQTVESEVLHIISQLLKDKCIQCDSFMNPIPLDLWLVLGSTLDENAFYVFDGIEPAILDEECGTIIENSMLFHAEDYVTQAEQYVKQHGEKQKIVKQWLYERKQIKKEIRKAERVISPKKPKWDFLKKR